MDKDLKRIVTETVNEFFQEAPERLVERGIREIYYDICPHCKQEICEKHEYTEDGGITWRHSECKGLIARPETPLEQISTGLRPYVKEARQIRKLARKQMGMAENVAGLPPSGEEKYSKQEPGGTMAAVNSTSLANEASKGVTEKEETVQLPVHGDAGAMDRSVIFLNASNVPLKVTVSEFTAMADDVHSVKKYYLRIDNG